MVTRTAINFTDFFQKSILLSLNKFHINSTQKRVGKVFARIKGTLLKPKIIFRDDDFWGPGFDFFPKSR